MTSNDTVTTDAMSLMTCRALHNMGYGDKDVKNRMELWEMIDNLGIQTNLCDLSILGVFSEISQSWRIAGSKITGLSTMQDGDIDIMIYLQGLVTALYGEDLILYMDVEDTPPGYCKLEIKTHDSEDYKVFYNNSKCVIRKHVKRYLSNVTVKSILKYVLQNEGYTTKVRGPALTILNPGRSEIDMVAAISIMWIPTVLHKWIQRNKCWPNVRLIYDIIAVGCEVVPIGCPGEVDKSQLWRLSFSQAEKILMQNLNGAQRKTYVILKKFIKEAVNSNIETKVLSSYVVKLLMLWMAEKITEKVWKENFVIERFIEALNFLKQFIYDWFFPHYFVVERNMFDHLMTTKDRACILSLLSIYIAEGPSCLLKCPSLYQEIQDCYLSDSLRYTRQDIINERIRADQCSVMYILMNSVLQLSLFITHYRETNCLTSMQIDHNRTRMRNINQFIKNETIIGSLLQRITRKLKRYDFANFWHGRALKILTKDVEKLLLNTNLTSVPGKVRLVAVEYAMKRLHIAYEDLQKTIKLVESQPESWIPLSLRGQYINETNVKFSSDDTVSCIFDNNCLFELMFTYDTSSLVPQGLRYGLYFDPYADVTDNINLIHVDCMALAYYMQAIVSDKLGKEEEAELSIRKLLIGALGKSGHSFLNFEYRETALNMVGHFLMTRRNYKFAFKIIRHSIILAMTIDSSQDPGILLLGTLLNKVFNDAEVLLHDSDQ